MNEWSTPKILEALRALDDTALPDDFLDIRTADYRLLRYPERILSPTLPAAQIVWSDTSRSFDAVFNEVATEVENWGIDVVHWWISSATRPLDTEADLLARGGVVSDSYQILALELRDGGVDTSPVKEIHVQLVGDENSLRDAIAVETEGWGRSMPDEQEIQARLAETLNNLHTSNEFQFVAYIKGRPVSTGICNIAGEMGRLYGAVTLADSRSRGCYRAVLSSRLRQAREFGATIAVTRGRPLTSGRILLNAGFEALDLENCYRVSVR
jgi:hypothetical protein